MILQCSDAYYNEAKPLDKIPLKCRYCKKKFYVQKKFIESRLKFRTHVYDFCSLKCSNIYRAISKGKPKISVICANCGEPLLRAPSDLKKVKNSFCNSSCSAIYNNNHKSHGTKRSKLEIWIEKQLKIIYPNILMDFNKTDAINSELDIFIPSLNIAFEINGIFHYEPIYGIDKLSNIQKNDVSKTKECHNKKIDLCIIDSSKEKYFKESSSKKYLEIITKIIDERIIISNSRADET